MREMSTSFRLKQTLGDCVVYLSGWSQSRLQPTFSLDVNAGLVWIDDAKFDRWQAKHQSAEWQEITLEKEYLPAPRMSAGRRRYLADNKNPARA